MDKKFIIIGFALIALVVIYLIIQLNKQNKMWMAQAHVNDVLIKKANINLSEIISNPTEEVEQEPEVNEPVKKVPVEEDPSDEPPTKKSLKKNENQQEEKSEQVISLVDEQEAVGADDSGESNDNKLSEE